MRLVENFPGFPDGVRGPEMMDKFRAQSIKFGTKIITETISKIDLSQRPFRYWREGQEEHETETTDILIIATGASAKRLNLPGEETYWQSGISACAVCDGAVPIFRYAYIKKFSLWDLNSCPRNKPLAVIGGGDSAAEEATCECPYWNSPAYYNVNLQTSRNMVRMSMCSFAETSSVRLQSWPSV